MRLLKPFYPFESTLPSVFKGVLPTMLWDEGVPPPFRLDVEEGDKAYMIYADLPGVKKEGIAVDIDGASVTIRADARRVVPENKEPVLLHTERFLGTLSRTFTLPMEIDPNATTARYENGVLTLTLPKKIAGAGRRLVIN